MKCKIRRTANVEPSGQPSSQRSLNPLRQSLIGEKTENAIPCASEAGPSERPLRANGTGPRQPEGGQESHESTLAAENSINPHMKCKFRRTANVDPNAPKGRPEGSQKRTKRTHRGPRAPKRAPVKKNVRNDLPETPQKND